MNRRAALLAIAWLALGGGCATLPDSSEARPQPPLDWNDLQADLLAQDPDVERFRDRGPFAVATVLNREFRLSGSDTFRGDLYLSAHPGRAPLVILLHGYGNSKEHHASQAMHLATWGMHALTLQFPNRGPWIGHGRTLAKIAAAIRERPDIVDHSVDPGRIVLAGHSFGGASTAIALASRAPVAGGILLDPAMIGRELPGLLRKIDRPVMVLGADEQVSSGRGRSSFYRLVRRGVADVSVRGAAHEDAEFPLPDPALEPEAGPDRREEHQLSFRSALTAAAFSLAATGRFDYAWASYDKAIRNGKLVNPKRK
jgi:dienelactone hydrolase